MCRRFHGSLKKGGVRVSKPKNFRVEICCKPREVVLLDFGNFGIAPQYILWGHVMMIHLSGVFFGDCYHRQFMPAWGMATKKYGIKFFKVKFITPEKFQNIKMGLANLRDGVIDSQDCLTVLAGVFPKYVKI